MKPRESDIDKLYGLEPVFASVSGRAFDHVASAVRIETWADLHETADAHGNIPSSANTVREITTMVNATRANTGGDTSSERR